MPGELELRVPEVPPARDGTMPSPHVKGDNRRGSSYGNLFQSDSIHKNKSTLMTTSGSGYREGNRVTHFLLLK